MRWSPEQYEKHLSQQPKQAKYRNKKVFVDNLKFDSKKEYQRWLELKTLEKAGHIEGLQHQVSFTLAPSVKFIEAQRAKPALKIIVDFMYYQDNAWVIEDVKSVATMTTAFIIKRHLLLAQTGIQIRIVQ